MVRAEHHRRPGRAGPRRRRPRRAAARARRDPAAVDATLARLIAGGLVAVSPHGAAEVLTLTSAGEERHVALRAATRALTASMLDGLDPEKLATATTVLQTVTDRANARRTTA